MKEVIIFLFLFLIVFVFVLVVVNGRYIYIQLKYHFIGPPPALSGPVGTLRGPGGIDFPKRIIIPSIGVEAPIISAESTNENIIQRALGKGVVLYPDSNLILGHSSAFPWYKGDYGSVFSLLNKLEKGALKEARKYNWDQTAKIALSILKL